VKGRVGRLYIDAAEEGYKRLYKDTEEERLLGGFERRKGGGDRRPNLEHVALSRLFLVRDLNQ